MRYEVIAFLKDSVSGLDAEFFFVDSLRTLHVLEKKLSKDSKYEAWSVIDHVHINHLNRDLGKL